MKRVLLLLATLALAMLGSACNDESALQPALNAKGSNGAAAVPSGLVPDGLYSLAFNYDLGAYAGFELISKVNGLGTPIWNLQVDPTTGLTPLGLAFDLDGTMYTTMNYLSFVPEECWSQFARVNAVTGAVTMYGPRFPMNTCGGDIDNCGNYYTAGMDVPHLGYIHGDGYLYRFDKETGEATQIGNTGWTDWMDFAFDSHNQLYGTTQNKLFKLDPATGEVRKITPITGVPGDPPPPPYTLIQEMMTIAFDANDVLYGTAINVEWDTGHGAPVMRIDVETGQATLLGYTEQVYNHGGDIFPLKVRVAHSAGSGVYRCITVDMNALASHLAHGDYVPGTAGRDCDCPGVSSHGGSGVGTMP